MQDDDSIPMLTEEIAFGAPQPAPAPGSPAARGPSAAPVPARPAEAQGVENLPEPHAEGRGELDWDALADEIRERVLRDLHDRIDYALETRIVETISAALQLALRDMTAQLHESLRDSMREVVSAAVSQEIEALRTRGFRQGELGL